ncbi:MAG: 4-phosphoerythronate dehydrogenase [Halioglobus sp.]|nr:4-phosphoerythronate dehydrogenase [Halioglobus sp.]
MTVRVLADENIPGLEQLLGPEADVRRCSGRRLRRADLDGADALLVRSVTRVDGSLLAGTPVAFVGTATSGFDHVDRSWLESADIGFAHAPGSNANAVVEYVLTAIAAIGDTLERLLEGARVGIVGGGRVGTALARRLAALGIDYCVYDPWLPEGEVAHAADLSQVLRCDIVSLHCELTREAPWPSEHLIDRAALGHIGTGSLLINTSRGPVVDNRALLQHLGERGGPGVVLDVWEGEPDIDPPLLDRVALGTAHIAGYSLDGKWLASRMICQALAGHFGFVPPEGTGATPGAPPAVAVPEGLSDAPLVRFLLRARYDILRDDALLRGAIAGAGRLEARERFDLLRRDYRQRRELAASRVCGRLGPEARALVHALGCEYSPETLEP